MLPDSLAGLVLFVALLTPGFVYLESRERRHPGIDYSVLRETSVVVVTSAVAISIVGALVGVARALRPAWTPDVGAYVRDGSSHFEAHYLEFTLWLLGLIALACGIARLMAVPPAWVGRLGGDRLGGWIDNRRGDGQIEQESGWTAALKQNPGTTKFLEIVLTDGTTLFGTLLARNMQIEETADREIVLAAPIKVRQLSSDWNDLAGTGTLVVSAARIKYFTVTYVDPQQPAAAAQPAG